MSQALLSIVIPTYNRVNALRSLLRDLEDIVQTHGTRVQVVICNNASTDATGTLLEHYASLWPASLKVMSRKVNLGMEGNIACALNEGDGKYIWMLSDHQGLCVQGVHRAIRLMETLEFDIGHAKVLQWSAVLPAPEKMATWDLLQPEQRGAMLFSLGNLSTLVFRREIGERATRGIFKACYWSYPHLGVISQIGGSTRFVEFDSMSAFPEGTSGAKLVHHYDKISVRYRSNLVGTETLCRQAGISFSRRGFFTADYRASFRNDVLHFLLQPDVTRAEALRTLLPVIRVNPWSLKLIGSFVLFGVLLVPMRTRMKLAQYAKDLFISRRSRRTL